MSVSQVVVIGAGVSGLTTAVCLAEVGISVRVLAERPASQSVSAVAGAMWGPSFQQPLDKTLAWTETSLREFQRLAGEPGTGVRMAPALTVGDLPAGSGAQLPQVAMIPDLRECGPDELPAGFGSGSRATMPLVDMPRYLDYLQDRLKTAGGEIEIRGIGSLEEAAGFAPIVLNCSGLGARALADDPSVRPVRGQHVLLSNPGLDELFMEIGTAAEWTCFFPHADRVVCGGVSVPDSWDTSVDDELTERIVARCRGVEPRLADAEILGVITGLRPDRPAVRVEVERVALERLGSAVVVHNYGHGGNGVSLSWGCAGEAAALAADRISV
jgi:D-amino-acid oxidase